MAKKKASNVALWIIMALLIAGLAGFGATNFGGSVRTVATVGDEEVLTDEYVRALQGQMRNFQQMTGQQMTLEQARALGFDRSALAQVIQQAALRDATAKAGLSAGDENVSREITQMRGFQGLGGTFDRQTYEATLRQSGINTRDFETLVRSGIAGGILEAAVTGGVEAPDLFVDTLMEFALETRDVTWARLTEENLDTPLQDPTDAELAGFHSDNPEMFTQGETRVIAYAWLTPDMIVDDIEIDDAQLREAYDAEIDSYRQPERRLVERLVFSSQADAEAARSAIDSGETDFDALVADRGLSLDDIDLGEATIEDLGAAGEALFALTEPGVAGPLPSSLGPALYRINAILNAQETSFEEARDDLIAIAAADRARRIILDTIPQVEDLLAGGATLDILTERTSMEQGRIEWREDVTDGIAGYEEVRSVASGLNVGDFPELVELEDGGIAVLSVEEIRPPALRPLDDVRDDVAEAWRLEARESALLDQAEDLAQQIRGGREMAGLDLRLESDRGIDRSGFVEGTPPDFVDTVFDMELDEIRVLSADGDAWLLRLDRITGPDLSSEDTQVARAQFAGETGAQMAAGLMAAFTQAVLDESEVEINQSAINAVNASFN